MANDYALTPHKYLTEAEQDHLEHLIGLYRLTDLRNTTMLLFMLKTGARPQEVLNVTWSDIDFNRCKVFIKTLKGGNNRNLPLEPILVARLKLMGIGKGSARVFGIGYRQFNNIWALYRPCKKTLHCLRHTFAVNTYRRSRYNLKMVQYALGHTSINTTSIYLEIEQSMDELRAAIT